MTTFARGMHVRVLSTPFTQSSTPEHIGKEGVIMQVLPGDATRPIRVNLTPEVSNPPRAPWFWPESLEVVHVRVIESAKLQYVTITDGQTTGMSVLPEKERTTPLTQDMVLDDVQVGHYVDNMRVVAPDLTGRAPLTTEHLRNGYVWGIDPAGPNEQPFLAAGFDIWLRGVKHDAWMEGHIATIHGERGVSSPYEGA